MVRRQYAVQVNIRFISELISGISKILEKLLKYFRGTSISTSLVLPLTGALPVIFVLNLVSFGTSF